MEVDQSTSELHALAGMTEEQRTEPQDIEANQRETCATHISVSPFSLYRDTHDIELFRCVTWGTIRCL